MSHTFLTFMMAQVKVYGYHSEARSEYSKVPGYIRVRDFIFEQPGSFADEDLGSQ